MTDRQSSDTETDRQRAGVPHPFTPTDSDGDDADSPFVPTRGCDTRPDGERPDEVPNTPTYGECLVAVFREVCGR